MLFDDYKKIYPMIFKEREPGISYEELRKYLEDNSDMNFAWLLRNENGMIAVDSIIRDQEPKSARLAYLYAKDNSKTLTWESPVTKAEVLAALIRMPTTSDLTGQYNIYMSKLVELLYENNYKMETYIQPSPEQRTPLNIGKSDYADVFNPNVGYWGSSSDEEDFGQKEQKAQRKMKR